MSELQHHIVIPSLEIWNPYHWKYGMKVNIEADFSFQYSCSSILIIRENFQLQVINFFSLVVL